MYQSMNIIEFQRKFSSQQACLDALFEARWPRGFVCPHCQHNDCYRLSKRRSVQCTSCRQQTSITSGTLFHKTKTSLQKWFWLMFLMSQDKGGISTKRAADLLGMHYATVWTMMHKIRTAMAERQKGTMLSGLVEVDEALFGGRLHLGKSESALSNKRSVCVIVERLRNRAGDAALIVLEDQSGDSLRQAVEDHVEPMTHIQTDGLFKNSYLHGLAGKLRMTTIGKNFTEDGPLKNVDRVTSLAKRALLGTYHQYCSGRHLQKFLAEHTFRFNRRYRWCQLFSRTLKACALGAPVQYAAIC